VLSDDVSVDAGVSSLTDDGGGGYNHITTLSLTKYTSLFSHYIIIIFMPIGTSFPGA